MGLWITKRKENKKIYWDIELTKGDSAYITVTLTDLQEQGIALREDDVVRCQVRAEQGTLIIDGEAVKTEDGGLVWRIAPEDTKGIDPGEYVWDMQLELPDSGDVFTFIPLSNFELLEESTRRYKE